MFTPILGRVSVQNESSSPGAWAQLHPDNKLNTTVTATRHLIFPDVNTNRKFFLFIFWVNFLLERDSRNQDINCC